MKHPSQFRGSCRTSLAARRAHEYVHHVGSAVFARPPGLARGQHWGDALLYLILCDHVKTGNSVVRSDPPS